MPKKTSKLPGTEFGRYLRMCREDLKLDMTQAAARAGVTKGYWGNLERGQRRNVESFRVWQGLKRALQWTPPMLEQAQRLMDKTSR